MTYSPGFTVRSGRGARLFGPERSAVEKGPHVTESSASQIVGSRDGLDRRGDVARGGPVSYATGGPTASPRTETTLHRGLRISVSVVVEALGTAAAVWVLPFVILAIGMPVVLLIRQIIRLGGWLLAAIR